MVEYPLDDVLLVALRKARPTGDEAQLSPHGTAAVALLERIVASEQITDDAAGTIEFPTQRQPRISSGRGSDSTVTSRKRVRLRFVLLAGFAVLAVAVASAFALGYPAAIDFYAAKKAQNNRFVSFERTEKLEAFLGRSWSKYVLAGPARRITEVSSGGRDHVLALAALKGGGFCESWSNATFVGLECGPHRTGKPIEAQTLRHFSSTIQINGTTHLRAGAQLKLRYQDGSSNEIPVVWVSPPINAGFFFYSIPSANQKRGHYPVSLTLLTSAGKPIAQTKLSIPARPRTKLTVHRLPEFGSILVPKQALYAKRQLLFQGTASLPTRAGGIRHHRVGLWIAPQRGGGTCVFGLISARCGPQPRYREPLPIEPNFDADTLCCQVGTNVARVELRFQDGDRIELYPKHSYLLDTIPIAHYRPGHRLTEEVAYDRSGHIIGSHTMPTKRPGIYPCAHPSVKIDGYELCP